jgi:hypothetical protein
MTTIRPEEPSKHRIVLTLGKLEIEISGWIAVWGSIIVSLAAVFQYPIMSASLWSSIQKLVFGA